MKYLIFLLITLNSSPVVYSQACGVYRVNYVIELEYNDSIEIKDVKFPTISFLHGNDDKSSEFDFFETIIEGNQIKKKTGSHITSKLFDEANAYLELYQSKRDKIPLKIILINNGEERETEIQIDFSKIEIRKIEDDGFGNLFEIDLGKISLTNFLIQETEFDLFEYISQSFSFTFEHPKKWIISREFDGTGYFLNCKLKDNIAVSILDCHEGYNFRIKYLEGDINLALEKMRVEKKESSSTFQTWLTQNKYGNVKIIIPTLIERDDLTILYYTFEEYYTCQKKKKKRKKGKTQYIYFSNGENTVCFVTDGRKIENEYFEKLIQSFVMK